MVVVVSSSSAPRARVRRVRTNRRGHRLTSVRTHAGSDGIDVPYSPAGNNIDSGLMKSMQEKIQTALEASSVSVVDTSGDGQHVAIDVVADVFEGKTEVQRQRLVYKAIWEELQVRTRTDGLRMMRILSERGVHDDVDNVDDVIQKTYVLY